MKRVVGYVRISTDNQKDNTSIELQIEKIELQCKLNDLELVKIFKDEGFSAKSIERAEYKNMMDFIENKDNDIHGLFVYKADRIHRSLKNLLTMIDRLNELKIAFKSITEQFDTTTAQGVLFLQMIGSFSEFERKLIAERFKSGRVAKGEKNLYPGGKIPIGYKLIDNNILEVDEETAPIVKDIFAQRMKGKKIEDIGNKYNMSKQRISYILKNKIYLGNYSYDGKIENNKISFKIPQIISYYQYNKANSIKKGRL